MFRSLRFRLPALFLVGIVLAGLISTLIAVKLFQDYARGRKFSELSREATGLAQLYADRAGHQVFSSNGLAKARRHRSTAPQRSARVTAAAGARALTPARIFFLVVLCAF